MSLFKTHNVENEQAAREVLIATAKVNLAKYITCQDKVNDIITNLNPEKELKLLKKKSKKCAMIRVDKLFFKMQGYQGVVGEVKKSFAMLFGEEIDIQQLVQEVAVDMFGENKKIINVGELVKQAEQTGSYSIPDDAPEHVKEMCDTIMKAFSDRGFSPEIEVIDMKHNNFGLKPGDFDNPVEFFKAVREAKAKWHEENDGKAPEAVLNDAVVNATVAQNGKEKKNNKLN